ncbi:hypothetical protein BESB_017840 [Besnoitia besnoiti]|uniref:SP-RING-type domain-containing protein n=1 Tax=Besnoitia besnoiti TaxID=94643 RepID=A0A2A9M984_BESBE|nr:hypothetical protein BESB_017840 [Besnoitia besnoiti]PFH32466.1 hypothetical protein BESB_017840 [Besnoitia besnoiti]
MGDEQEAFSPQGDVDEQRSATLSLDPGHNADSRDLAAIEEVGLQLQTELNRVRDLLQKTVRRLAAYAGRALPPLAQDASERQTREHREARKRMRAEEAAAIASAEQTAETLWDADCRIFAPFLQEVREEPRGPEDDDEAEAGAAASERRRRRLVRERRRQEGEATREHDSVARILASTKRPAATLEDDPCYKLVQPARGAASSGADEDEDVCLGGTGGEESEREDAEEDAVEGKKFRLASVVFSKCPITQEPFQEPVSTRFASEGRACVHVFEKEAILAQLRRSDTPGAVSCPFAGCRAVICATSLQDDIETKLRMQRGDVRDAQDSLDREPPLSALLAEADWSSSDNSGSCEPGGSHRK